MYALIDCNNFYASCERLFNPTLDHRPVVVLSNNDGCVIARSNEAKRLGIPMGAPAFEYRYLFERQRVAVFSANFPLYGDISQRVMNILSTYSPNQEIYSIDECFLDLSGIEPLREQGLEMRARVNRWVGIPISVGIAPTKTLAKAANRIAKKFPNHSEGVHVIDTEELRVKVLKWLPVDDVWGIGRRYAKKLHAAGIHTAYDFVQLPESWVLKNMTIVGLRLQKELRGIPAIEMEMPEKRQSIATTRSFDRDYRGFDELRERVSTFTSIAAEKLRAQGSMCRRVVVFIETNRFRDEADFYANRVTVKSPFPTSSTLELVHYAVAGLKAIFLENRGYKRAGVVLMDFVDANEYQPDLFLNSNPKHKKLMEAIDTLNNKHGKRLVRLANQDAKIHKMRQERLSKAYTTDINQLLEVRV
ncbi:MAG: Y-family DNA polymerase [Bacteroidota bacterium]|jgi:DNA polymerase V|nr:Y-family DNA polymerase [Bacteroidota bacterium]HHU96209.1 Y-family DNA polymerase [Petrimonas sp.]